MSENDTVAPDAMLRMRRGWFEDYVPIEAARDLERENVALRAERDALLAALTGVLADMHEWNYEFDPYGGDFPTTCKFCYERFYIPERHARDCPWRVAVELRDRLAREAQHER